MIKGGIYLSKIEESVEALVKDKIENLGYELYDVLFLKEGSNRILRIVIDNNKGISLDDCEKVNDEVKDIIDEADLVKEQYFLEISSPGIERLLRKDWQLKKFKGEIVEVKLFKKDDKGNKNYIGNLDDVTDDILKIKTDEIINIDRKNISQVKTVYTD
ncbi:MAG TPA: ribosome maturation factor RimP [Clostridiales bacterium]|nr:ribosome maturation factor RimP [Clostridiales bacterium]